jgi:hypothetical protein
MNRIKQPKLELMIIKRYPLIKFKVRELGLNFY